MRTTSWIVRRKFTGEVLRETFNKATVDRINALHSDQYETVPILQYLQELNAKIRRGHE